MLRTYAATLAVALALPFPAIAIEASTESAKPASASSSPFLSEADCFRDTPDYESWVQSISERVNGQDVSRERVMQAVPQRAFDFARSAFVCRVVSYASDGHTVFGYVVQPKQEAADGKRPLLVYNRGGNRSFGKIDSLQLFRELLPLAKAGYVVVASQYRGSTEGNARQFGMDEFGGKDVDDVLRLIDLSLTLPGTDANNIFMLGASRGGMMNYLVARQRTDIRAMATIAAATDLLAGLQWRPEMERVYRDVIPDYTSNKQAALESRSALRWVEQIPADLPVLLLHGEADDRVNVSDSRAMADRLKQLGRPHKLIVYAGDNHGLQKNRGPAHREILSWFRQHQQH